MTKSTDDTFKRHMAELDTGVYGPGFITGFRRAVTNNDRKRLGLSAPACMSPEQIDTLIQRIWAEAPSVGPVSAVEGLERLRKLHWTPQGKVKASSPFTEKQAAYLLAENDPEFRLVDFWDAGKNSLSNMQPVYQLRTKRGHGFEYWAGSWQSGFGFNLMKNYL